MEELAGLAGLARSRTVEDVEASVLAGRILADVAIEPLPIANSVHTGETIRPVAIPTDARDRLLGLANGVSPMALLERLLGRCAVALRRIPEDAETQLKHRLLSAMLDQGRALARDDPTAGNSAAPTDDAGAHRRDDDNSTGGAQAAEREEMVRRGEITPFETTQVHLPNRTTTASTLAAPGRATGRAPPGRRGGEDAMRRLKRAGEPSRQAPERITAVECPSCGRTITVRDGFTPDAELDAHIDRCSRGARTRRSDVASDVGDGLNDSDHDEHDAQADRARLRRLRRRGGGSESAAMRDASSEDDADGASPAKRRRDGGGRGREDARSATAPRQSAASHGVRHRARQQLLADDSNDVDFEERLETWWHEFGDDDADGEEASEGAADYVLDGGLRVHGAVATRLYGCTLVERVSRARAVRLFDRSEMQVPAHCYSLDVGAPQPRCRRDHR